MKTFIAAIFATMVAAEEAYCQTCEVTDKEPVEVKGYVEGHTYLNKPHYGHHGYGGHDTWRTTWSPKETYGGVARWGEKPDDDVEDEPWAYAWGPQRGYDHGYGHQPTYGGYGHGYGHQPTYGGYGHGYGYGNCAYGECDNQPTWGGWGYGGCESGDCGYGHEPTHYEEEEYEEPIEEVYDEYVEPEYEEYGDHGEYEEPECVDKRGYYEVLDIPSPKGINVGRYNWAWDDHQYATNGILDVNGHRGVFNQCYGEGCPDCKDDTKTLLQDLLDRIRGRECQKYDCHYPGCNSYGTDCYGCDQWTRPTYPHHPWRYGQRW